MRANLWIAAALLAVTLSACSFQAQQCCDCMATKDTFLGDCVKDTLDQCVSQLSQNPPDTDAISGFCYGEDEGFCEESCADILYRK